MHEDQKKKERLLKQSQRLADIRNWGNSVINQVANEIKEELEEEDMIDRMALRRDKLVGREDESKLNEIVEGHHDQLDQLARSMHPELEDRFEQRNAELYWQVSHLEAQKAAAWDYENRYLNAVNSVRSDEWKKSD